MLRQSLGTVSVMLSNVLLATHVVQHSVHFLLVFSDSRRKVFILVTRFSLMFFAQVSKRNCADLSPRKRYKCQWTRLPIDLACAGPRALNAPCNKFKVNNYVQLNQWLFTA